MKNARFSWELACVDVYISYVIMRSLHGMGKKMYGKKSELYIHLLIVFFSAEFFKNA